MKNSLLGVFVIAMGLSYFWFQGQKTLSLAVTQENNITTPNSGAGAPPPLHSAGAAHQTARKKGFSSFLPILKTLPKNKDAQRLAANNSHQMPPELINKIAPLIKINRLVKENPDLEPEALEFYESCAAETDLMNAVRARCLTHLRSLAKKRGETVDLSQYSAHLIRLSEFINL